MKNLIAASTLLVLIAGTASAAGLQRNERPDLNLATSTAEQTTQVSAKDVFSNRELRRAGLTMNQAISVTVFDSPSIIDERGNDN
jgi:hypothetical protein